MKKYVLPIIEILNVSEDICTASNTDPYRDDPYGAFGETFDEVFGG